MEELTLYQMLGQKIGIGSNKIIRKAAELKTLLNARAGSVTIIALRLSDTAQVVLCLDLASILLSQPVDKVQAIKLSGIKKTAYHIALKTLESVLDLNQKTSMRELAVQFGCTQAVSLAAQLLKKYKTEQCCDVETNSSLFQTAALICACKKLRIRIGHVKLREVTGVKRSTFDRLIVQMNLIADKIQAEEPDPDKTLGKRKNLLDAVEMAKLDGDSPATKRNKTEKDLEYYKNVDYNQWRKKLLEGASQENV